MPHAASSDTMGSMVRVVLLVLVVVMPGGLLLLPALAFCQLRHGKRSTQPADPSGPV